MILELHDEKGRTIYIPAARIESIRAISASQSERQCGIDYNAHVLCIQDNAGYKIRENAEAAANLLSKAIRSAPTQPPPNQEPQ